MRIQGFRLERQLAGRGSHPLGASALARRTLQLTLVRSSSAPARSPSMKGIKPGSAFPQTDSGPPLGTNSNPSSRGNHGLSRAKFKGFGTLAALGNRVGTHYWKTSRLRFSCAEELPWSAARRYQRAASAWSCPTPSPR